LCDGKPLHFYSNRVSCTYPVYLNAVVLRHGDISLIIYNSYIYPHTHAPLRVQKFHNWKSIKFTFVNWRWCIVQCVRFIPALQVSFPRQRPFTRAERLWPLHAPELPILLTPTFITERGAKGMYSTYRLANGHLKSPSTIERPSFTGLRTFRFHNSYTDHEQKEMPTIDRIIWKCSATIWDAAPNYTHSRYAAFSGKGNYWVNLLTLPCTEFICRIIEEVRTKSEENW
jgi:hypothetical protein